MLGRTKMSPEVELKKNSSDVHINEGEDLGKVVSETERDSRGEDLTTLESRAQEEGLHDPAAENVSVNQPAKEQPDMSSASKGPFGRLTTSVISEHIRKFAAVGESADAGMGRIHQVNTVCSGQSWATVNSGAGAVESFAGSAFSWRKGSSPPFWNKGSRTRGSGAPCSSKGGGGRSGRKPASWMQGFDDRVSNVSAGSSVVSSAVGGIMSICQGDHHISGGPRPAPAAHWQNNWKNNTAPEQHWTSIVQQSWGGGMLAAPPAPLPHLAAGIAPGGPQHLSSSSTIGAPLATRTADVQYVLVPAAGYLHPTAQEGKGAFGHLPPASFPSGVAGAPAGAPLLGSLSQQVVPSGGRMFGGSSLGGTASFGNISSGLGSANNSNFGTGGMAAPAWNVCSGNTLNNLQSVFGSLPIFPSGGDAASSTNIDVYSPVPSKQPSVNGQFGGNVGGGGFGHGSGSSGGSCVGGPTLGGGNGGVFGEKFAGPVVMGVGSQANFPAGSAAFPDGAPNAFGPNAFGAPPGNAALPTSLAGGVPPLSPALPGLGVVVGQDTLGQGGAAGDVVPDRTGANRWQ